MTGRVYIALEFWILTTQTSPSLPGMTLPRARGHLWVMSALPSLKRYRLPSNLEMCGATYYGFAAGLDTCTQPTSASINGALEPGTDAIV